MAFSIMSNRDFLKDEYFKLQDQYEAFDSRALQIYESWFEYYDSSLRSLFWAAGQTFVHLPYSLIILICLILFLRDTLM